MADSLIYTKLGTRETKKLVKLIGSKLSTCNFTDENTTIMAAHTPFYEDFRILEMSDQTAYPVVKRFALYKEDPETIYLMDFKPETLADVNRDAPLILTEDLVCDYIRFYYEFVMGERGKFFVIEAIDDIPWFEDPTPQMRKTIASVIDEVRFMELDRIGRYILKITVLFKNALFETKVAVTQEGGVETISHDVLIQDMPVQDQALGH